MKLKQPKKYTILLIAAVIITFSAVFVYAQDDDASRKVIKNGLLGAGTGAIAAGTSGGNAGTGALIGAGTGAIGGVLLDAITTPSSSSSRRRSAPPPQDDYYDDQGDEYYEEAPAPQQNATANVLKNGLVGAGTGAIAAGASGGNAGKGALIGAGTGVIGGALLDMISQPAQQPRRVYRRRQPVPQQQPVAVAPAQPQNVQVQEEPAGPEGGRKKIVKKYDETGKLVSEEETYY